MTRRLTPSALALAVAVIVLGPSPLAAQYQEPAGIHRTEPAVTSLDRPAGARALMPSAQTSAARVAHGVLIGAGVGAVTGVIVAAAIPHSSHDEDALGYIACGTIGAFVGMI